MLVNSKASSSVLKNRGSQKWNNEYDRTEDIDLTTLTLIPSTDATTIVDFSTNEIESNQSLFGSEPNEPATLESSTFDLVRNNNQVRCSVAPSRKVGPPLVGRPQNTDAIWKEGLLWPSDELIVVHSDIPTHTWTDATNQIPIDNQMISRPSESHKRTIGNSHRTQTDHCKQKLSIQRKTICSANENENIHKTEAQKNLIRSSTSQVSGRLVEKKETIPTSSVKSVIRKPQSSSTRVIQKVSIQTTPCSVINNQPETLREQRIQEYINRYFPGKRVNELVENMVEPVVGSMTKDFTVPSASKSNTTKSSGPPNLAIKGGKHTVNQNNEPVTVDSRTVSSKMMMNHSQPQQKREERNSFLSGSVPSPPRSPPPTTKATTQPQSNKLDKLYRNALDCIDRFKTKLANAPSECSATNASEATTQLGRRLRFTIAPSPKVKPSKSITLNKLESMLQASDALQTSEQGDNEGEKPNAKAEKETNKPTELTTSGSISTKTLKKAGDITKSPINRHERKKSPSPKRIKSLSKLYLSHTPKYFYNSRSRKQRSAIKQPVFDRPKKVPIKHSFFTKEVTSGFNSLADKLSRVTKLTQELTRIHSQLEQLRSYSMLGRYYCIADAYLSLLCTQLAPHVMKAMLSPEQCNLDRKRKRRGRKSHFLSSNLLSLSPSSVKTVLFKRRLSNALEVSRAAGLTSNLHNSVTLSQADWSKEVDQQCAVGVKSSASQFDQLHSRENYRNSSNCFGHLTGEIPQHTWSCSLAALPKWERRFLGIRDGDIRRNTVILVWKDKLELSPAQSNWLSRTAKRVLGWV